MKDYEGRCLTPRKPMTPLNWIFERDIHGYAGYRCNKCGGWVRERDPLVCECSPPIPAYAPATLEIPFVKFEGQRYRNHKGRFELLGRELPFTTLPVRSQINAGASQGVRECQDKGGQES